MHPIIRDLDWSLFSRNTTKKATRKNWGTVGPLPEVGILRLRSRFASISAASLRMTGPRRYLFANSLLCRLYEK